MNRVTQKAILSSFSATQKSFTSFLGIRPIAPISTCAGNNNLPQPTLSLSLSNLRWVRKFSSLQKKNNNTPCPFKTLGVPPESPYKIVKKSFFKLAMQYHPDTISDENDDNENDQDPAELFHQIRTAFESLMEDENGMAVLRPLEEDEDDNIWEDNKDFDSWFKEETGHHAPFMFEMDIETMREVAEITDSNEGGGLDRGGMWHLAKMVSQNVKDNDSASLTGGLLQLDTGEIQEEKTRLSRRRRRKR